MPKNTKPLRYETPHDVQMRLSGTIIRHEGRLAYVDGQDGLRVALRYLSNDGLDSSYHMVHSSDVALDISSIPLGWIGQGSSTKYLMRSPQRSQRQGVVPGSLNHMCFPEGNAGAVYHLGGVALTGQAFSDIYKMHHGDYSEGYKFLLLGKTCSLSRHWAVSFTDIPPPYGIVYHKYLAVGVFNRNTNTFFLSQGTLTKTRTIMLREITERIQNDKGVYCNVLEQPA